MTERAPEEQHRMSARRLLVSPSILSADFTRLGDEIRMVEKAGADMIHVDVMDGHFVPNITLGPVIVRAVRSVTDLPIDAHLMITDPARYAPAFIDAGASYVVFHQEVCEDAAGLIESIRERGAEAGMAVNPPNAADGIRPYLPDLGLVLVMTVNPGFAGQSFMGEVMPKLATIASWKKEGGHSFHIAVDGGVSRETAPVVARHGGEVLVAASAIFGADDPPGELRAIRSAAEAALADREGP